MVLSKYNNNLTMTSCLFDRLFLSSKGFVGDQTGAQQKISVFRDQNVVDILSYPWLFSSNSWIAIRLVFINILKYCIPVICICILMDAFKKVALKPVLFDPSFS